MRLLSRGIGRLLDFARPIPDAALPRIGEHVSSGAMVSLVALLLLTPGGPGFLAVAVLAGEADPLRSLIVAPVVSAVFLLTNLWSRSAHGRRHSNGLLLLTTFGIALGYASLGFTSGSRAEELVHFIVVLPALIAMFVPWKPVFALCGTALAIGCLVAGTSLIRGEPVWPERMLLVASVGVGVASALGQQLNRQFWLRFETARERLLAAERLSNLGRMTAGIAHELKTPLAAIQNSLESSRSLLDELERSIGHDGVTEDDLREIAAELGAAMEGLGNSADRATSYVRDIRHHGFGGGIRGPQKAFRVVDRFAAVAGLMSFRLRTSRVRLEIEDADARAVLFGDPVKFDQVLTNLVANALDSCEDSGCGALVALSCQIVDGEVTIAVQDDGPGVPPEVAPRLFEALFTTRVDGTGLGLPISRDLVQGEFGGNLCWVPSPHGARFEIRCAAADG